MTDEEWQLFADLAVLRGYRLQEQIKHPMPKFRHYLLSRAEPYSTAFLIQPSDNYAYAMSHIGIKIEEPQNDPG
jgi:hypothetical protein